MNSLTLKYVKTGEVRPPQAGEWFEGNRGFPVQAMFDFNAIEFPILREVVEESPIEEGK